MSRSKTSKAWMREHVNDPYVQKARAEGYRSRAAYKLLELDRKDRLLAPGKLVVDLGAAPGGWSQVAAAKLGARGRLVAVDILPMEPLPGVHFVQGDFREQAVLDALIQALGGSKADLVISDLAPNISGIGVSDQARAMYLAELALEFARQCLKPGGSLVVKVFQGAGFTEFLTAMRKAFAKVGSRKPEASRGRSSEMYLLGKGLKSGV
ncbi:MAG: 23S rRNA (uridine(2552)-2'-O)-methyltransferase RlmE [Burkholderiales bacterium]|nr:23S rRNA (uridine(2552)-2'-O)-methyltransferase RlmE [Burkholderiales bacterium]